MNNSLALASITGGSFRADYGYIATPVALCRVLRRSEEVQAIRAGCAAGEISEKNLRDFVDHLLAGLKTGEPFIHDLAVAAIAVALETSSSQFAEEYLNSLANLQLAEMPMSIRVARQCLKDRVNLARTVVHSRDIGPVEFKAVEYEEAGRCWHGSQLQTFGEHDCGVRPCLSSSSFS